jgi:hypothetical protein
VAAAAAAGGWLRIHQLARIPYTQKINSAYKQREIQFLKNVTAKFG